METGLSSLDGRRSTLRCSFDTPFREAMASSSLHDACVNTLRFLAADAVERGAYMLEDPDRAPDVTLLATGSEVHLTRDAAAALSDENVAARVVSLRRRWSALRTSRRRLVTTSCHRMCRP